MAFAPAEEALKLHHVREDLRREFPQLPEAVVVSQVDATIRRFADARIRAYVPVLVRAGARSELRRLV